MKNLIKKTNLLSIILLPILTINSSFADGFKDEPTYITPKKHQKTEKVIEKELVVNKKILIDDKKNKKSKQALDVEKDKNVKLNKQSKKDSYKCENINNISNFIIKSPENISSKDIVTFINKNYVPKLDLNNEEKRKMNKIVKKNY